VGGLTRFVREENFAGLLISSRSLLAVEQMVQHSVEDLFGVGLGNVEHQLRLAQEVLHVEVCSDLRRKVLHRDFLRQKNAQRIRRPRRSADLHGLTGLPGSLALARWAGWSAGQVGR